MTIHFWLQGLGWCWLSATKPPFKADMVMHLVAVTTDYNIYNNEINIVTVAIIEHKNNDIFF